MKFLFRLLCPERAHRLEYELLIARKVVEGYAKDKTGINLPDYELGRMDGLILAKGILEGRKV